MEKVEAYKGENLPEIFKREDGYFVPPTIEKDKWYIVKKVNYNGKTMLLDFAEVVFKEQH